MSQRGWQAAFCSMNVNSSQGAHSCKFMYQGGQKATHLLHSTGDPQKVSPRTANVTKAGTN